MVEEQEPAAVYVHAGSVFGQVRRDQQFNPVLPKGSVIASVAAVCAGIDRYLNDGAGSTGVAEEFDDRFAPLFLDVGNCALSKAYFHVISPCRAGSAAQSGLSRVFANRWLRASTIAGWTSSPRSTRAIVSLVRNIKVARSRSSIAVLRIWGR